MGTHFAPCYAYLVLAYLEESYARHQRINIETNFQNILKTICEISVYATAFVTWNENLNIDTFNEMLNDLHKDLKFTMEKHSSETAFWILKYC